MTVTELKDKTLKLGFTITQKTCHTKSEYYRISGQLYRFSDHTQPSHYQCRNYIDVMSYDEIYNHLLIRKQKLSEINTNDEYIFVDEEGGYFVKNKNYKG